MHIEQHPSPAPPTGSAASPTSLLRWSCPDWLFALVLGIAVFLTYAPVWHGGRLWDDPAHMTRPELRSWSGLGRIWFELGATQQYYPLLHSAFWVEYRLFGDNTTGYHLVNLALHALATGLFGLLLRRLRVPGAWLAAGLFAFHPVMVESVAWISEQKNTLSACFYLGAALAYLRFDADRRKRWYGLALSLFAFALLSKTVTATLPGALAVVLWWQRGRLDAKRDWLPLIPFFALGVAGGLLTAWVEQKFIGAEGAAFVLTPIERGLIAGRALWFYLGKLFWPANLIFIYPRWSVSQAVAWPYLYPVAAALAFAGLWTLRRWRRGPLAAGLLFAGTLFPALGFFNVYPFRFSFVADHFQYLASLGVLAAVAAGLVELAHRAAWSKTISATLAVALLLGLGALTWRQSQPYRDTETLYRTTLDRNPTCWLAHNNLGDVLLARGQIPEARAHFETALQLKPDYAEAHTNLSIVLLHAGRTTDAIAHGEEALRLKPHFAEAHYDLGNALVRAGRSADAIMHYEQALRIDPSLAEAHNKLGLVLFEQGRVMEAIARYEVALRLAPASAGVHSNLANALTQAGRLLEARAHAEEAMRLNPALAEAHTNLGNVLYRLGQPEAAIPHYREAVRLSPDLAAAHNNLGTALSRTGRLAEAIAEYEAALRLRPDDADTHFYLANTLVLAGRPREAVPQYEATLRLKPDQARARENLARTRAMLAAPVRTQ